MIFAVMGGEVAWCAFYWAYVSTDASKYKVFPQATCFFPDGGDRKFTFPIKQDGITKRCDFKDGSIGVEIEFLYRYLYQSRDMAFPYVFQKMLARIPSDVGKSFKFISMGEYWHKGMVVETSNCENVVFYCFKWVRENDEWKPIGVLLTAHNYDMALKDSKVPKDGLMAYEGDLNWMLYKNSLKREDEQAQYTSTLEQAHEVALKQQGKGFKKQVDDSLEAIRSRVSRIQDVREPLWKKVFNFKTLAKALIVIFAVWAFLHFALGVI